MQQIKNVLLNPLVEIYMYIITISWDTNVCKNLQQKYYTLNQKYLHRMTYSVYLLDTN